jgi:hypothetical protein
MCLFHEIKPNFHCADIHEIDARSTPFCKENLYRIFGNLTNCFSLVIGYRVNIVKMLLDPVLFFFLKFKTGRKNISANFRLSAQSSRCCVDISVFNYVTARKVLHFYKLTGLKGRNRSIKALLVTDNDDDDDDRFTLILQSGKF